MVKPATEGLLGEIGTLLGGADGSTMVTNAVDNLDTTFLNNEENQIEQTEQTALKNV